MILRPLGPQGAQSTCPLRLRRDRLPERTTHVHKNKSGEALSQPKGPALPGAEPAPRPSPARIRKHQQSRPSVDNPCAPETSGPGPDSESRDLASRTPCHPPLAGPLPGPALSLFPTSLRPLVRLHLETADGGPLPWEK
ncbi:hypothetical protein D623_10024010 [Myotis brandtii]|uniref:Uncharacterized protein n=1 Tax=Myotis brandtii TaxID=109478 RepID=S7PW21_MYOBR|nr:hypothetical protein D623_10024010 [Myotis brandtii]